MSWYPINSNVEISNDGTNMVRFLDNTQPTKTFDIETDASANLHFTSGDSGTVATIYQNGDGVESQIFRIKKGANRIKIGSGASLPASYDFNFPSVGPTVAQTFSTIDGTNTTFYDIHAQRVITVRKNPGPGEFAFIKDAIDSIPVSPDPEAPTDTNRYVIYVNAGEYNEDNFTIPEYVFLVGVSMEAVRVIPTNPIGPFITLGLATGIAFMTFINGPADEPTLYFYNCGDFSLIHKIEFNDCPCAMLAETDALATEQSLVFIEYTSTDNSGKYSIKCIDTNGPGGFGSDVSFENFFSFGHNDYCIYSSGQNSSIIAQAYAIQGDGLGNGVYVINGGHVEMRAGYFNGWDIGILVPNAGNTAINTELLLSGTLYDNCNYNIKIEKLAITGNADGYTEYSKTVIPKLAPFFIANRDQNIITVALKGANFTSVGAALAAITDNSPTNRYTIYVGPGIYYEGQLVMKEYVAILGFFQTQTILVATNNSVPFIIGAGYAAIDRITLSGGFGASAPTYMLEYMGHTAGNHFRLDHVAFGPMRGLANIGSVNGPCLFLMFACLINVASSMTNGIQVTDAGPSNYPIQCMIDGLIWNPLPSSVAATTSIMNVTSVKPGATIPNINVAFQDCSVGQNTITSPGTCLTLSGPVFAIVESCIIGGWTRGVYIPNTAAVTTLITGSITMVSNVTDVLIQNPNAVGTLSGNMSVNKITIDPAATFAVAINDPAGNFALTGTIFQGPSWNKITNISDQIQHASTLGAIDQQAGITFGATGLDITIDAGNGYVFLGTLGNYYLKYIEWVQDTITLPDNDLSWIFVDDTGTISSSTSKPDILTVVTLSAVKTFAGNVTYVQEIGPVINNLSSQLDSTLRTVFGPIVQSGLITSAGTTGSLTCQVSSGVYNLSTTQYTSASTDPITMIGNYRGIGATNPIQNTLTAVPLNWDDGSGTLVGMTAANWVKHSLYVLGHQSGVSQFFLVYGQELFTSLLDAQSGPQPIPPSTFVGNLCPIAGLIVNGGDTGALPAAQITDIRPTLQFRSNGLSVTSDHNSLTNLTVGNAHPQYFRVDGTSTMTGNISLSTFNIVGATNTNLWNGMNPNAHASRHVPGGVDALPTATCVSIGTANSEGVAASFSRSDHVHDHGNLLGGSLHALATGSDAGFMSAADKTLINTATSLAVANSLMLRSAGNTVQLWGLQFQGTGNPASVMNILPGSTDWGSSPINVTLPAQSGTISYLTAAQTFTNKTITDTTNIVTASRLRTNGGVGADVYVNGANPPIQNAVLTATSGTTAAWALPPRDLTVTTTQISVGTTISRLYLPWNNTFYNNYTTRTVSMWVTPSSAVGKNLTVSILPNGGASLGSLTINGGAATPAFYTFTFTDPGVNTRLDIVISRTGGVNQNPIIEGITINLS